MNGSLRLAAAVLGLVIVTATTSVGHGDPSPAPKWVGLSTTTAGSGAALVLLRRGSAPTLGICARYREPPQLPTGAKETLRSRGGGIDIRNYGDFIQICVRAPAHEWLTAAWLFTSNSPRAAMPVAPSPTAQLQARLFPTAALASQAPAPYAIAVVGAVDVDAVAKQLRTLAAPAARAAPTAQPSPAARLEPGTQLIGWKAPQRGSPERAALEVATTRLARRLSSLPGVEASPGSASRLVFLQVRGSEPNAVRTALKRELKALSRIAPLAVRHAIADSERRIRQQLDHHVGVAGALLDGLEGEKKPRRALRHLQLVSGVTASSVTQVAAGALALESSAWLSGGKP